MELERNGVNPLYTQIADNIREKIRSGELHEGSRIDSQTDLAQKLGVSRITIRQAIKILEKEGLVVTKQGKGTFVSTKAVSQELGALLSFGEIAEAQGLDHVVRVMDFKWVLPPEEVREFLGGDYEEPALRIKRLHLIHDSPLALADIYLPLEVGAVIQKRDIEKLPLYTIMERRLGLSLGQAIQKISATSADNDTAAILNIRPGYPLLVAQRRTFSAEGKPVEFITFHYHSDCYHFIVGLNRAKSLPMVVPQLLPDDNHREERGGEFAGIEAILQLSKVL